LAALVRCCIDFSIVANSTVYRHYKLVSMSWLDWLVLLGTLAFIVIYGIIRTRNSGSMESYLKGNNENRWWEIGLSVMATQASAITFLSTPGQAYEDGMRFVQFYFGLPLAMIIISVFFIPVYYKLKVYTAYEFLEKRFDVRTRTLTASLFLVQRGLAAGITIYAPSIIISQILGWDLHATILFIGVLVTLYVLTGGTRAVAITHKQQMAIIFLGMFIAFGYLIWHLRETGGLSNSLQIAGALGKMNIIDTRWDMDNRYTLWSGLLGGLFLQLSYFGCDQSQVGRYLGGESVRHSRLGLMFNGLLKIPMQFFILLTGVLVYVFYLLNTPPVFFDQQKLQSARNSAYAAELKLAEDSWSEAHTSKQEILDESIVSLKSEGEWMESNKQELIAAQAKEDAAKSDVAEVISKHYEEPVDDHDYIFMTFVMQVLPVGLVGLLFAVIFSAGMSSTSSEINALAGTFAVDIYKRLFKREASEKHYVFASRMFTLLFGALAITFAMVASLFDNLIEAVNIIGSLFYGTILGIFLTALLLKKIQGQAVFLAAILTQLFIFYTDFSVRYSWNLPVIKMSYLWYNVLACFLVMALSLAFQHLVFRRQGTNTTHKR
jgi:SSS family solute:Na+ symporter